MERNIFLIVLIVVLVILYVNKMYETFVSSSYDITAPITVDMDWKGAMLSKYPYYTNNLVNPPADVLSQIQQLQTYQPKEDGSSTSTYVSRNMNVQPNLDDPENREGFEQVGQISQVSQFSMMNPYVPN